MENFDICITVINIVLINWVRNILSSTGDSVSLKPHPQTQTVVLYDSLPGMTESECFFNH